MKHVADTWIAVYVASHALLALTCWATAAMTVYPAFRVGIVHEALALVVTASYGVVYVCPLIGFAIAASSIWTDRKRLYIGTADLALCVLHSASFLPFVLY